MNNNFEDYQPIDPEIDFYRKRDEILGEIEDLKSLVRCLYHTDLAHNFTPQNQEEIDHAIADVSMSLHSMIAECDRQFKVWEEYHQERLDILPEQESNPDIPF